MPIRKAHVTGQFWARARAGTAIDKANGNGAVPDSDETGTSAIEQANGDGAVPHSDETATAAVEHAAGGAGGPEMLPLEAWVPEEPAPENPVSARANTAERPSPASGRVLHRVGTAPLYPPPLTPPDDPEQVPRAWARRPQTWPQRVGIILIAAVCVAAAVWYVPGVVSTDRQMFTGSVASGGVITLNFPDAGEIRRVDVLAGQAVHKGQVLASETAPDATAVVKAETAAIAADREKIAQLKAAQAQGVPGSTAAAQLSAANSQVAFDEAQLNSYRVKLAASRITAPASGVVVAANGQPGQVVTPSGIKDYAADSHSSQASQRPAFSLLPDGPQPLRASSPKDSTLPVIALRTSATWTVVALIPESATSRVAQARAVSISVPAAGITNVPGRIDELLPSPVTTTEGTAYQAVIKITGHVNHEPLNGMAVDIRLR